MLRSYSLPLPHYPFSIEHNTFCKMKLFRQVDIENAFVGNLVYNLNIDLFLLMFSVG